MSRMTTDADRYRLLKEYIVNECDAASKRAVEHPDVEREVRVLGNLLAFIQGVETNREHES